MPFDPVTPNLDLPALESRVLERWKTDDVFAQSMRQREGAEPWIFYEGPPTANGRPGLHHVWARSFKDLYPRFQTMRGRLVARKGGWDCHGLPVELEVEKQLGFTGKAQIESFGLGEFNRLCRESVHRYVDEWASLTERIGMWIDTENAYWTLSNEFVGSVWWQFNRLWDQGLIYEGFKVIPYCGRCGTALSSHEVAQGYQDVTEPSVYVRFPLHDRDYDLLVWTTTPWTLISNVAAAVGPDVPYVRVRDSTGGRDLVLAASRVSAVLGEDIEIVGELSATDLVGATYDRPFNVLPIDAGACRVVAADFVTIDDGSGIVHLAPAFGEIDREVGIAQGLPVLNPVDSAARFDESVPDYVGQFVKDADAGIIEDLASRGILVRTVDYTHSYPHCWRCTTPLIYYAKTTWFAKTSERRDEMLKENESIGWHPEHIKHGRFGDWLSKNIDWALSRDRYWGTPIPIWRCESCGTDTCVGSVADLSALAGKDLGELDLHRPAIDDIVISCPGCGEGAHRITPVLDAWFDSGSMPAAQIGYPANGEDLLEHQFPADFICEAIDQTRGWFYSLLAVNTLVFGRSPYRNVVCLAHIVDRDGQKMSKTRGNVIDPWEILDSKGADALRWYFFSAGSPWVNRRVYAEGIDDSTRHFLLTLWNTYSFFVTYASLDNWEPDDEQNATADALHLLDRWITSRLNATVQTVTNSLEDFDALEAAQSIAALVDDLSNWYIRRSRSRFWKSSDAGAHRCLHDCLLTISKLLAPFCPFVADEIFRNLNRASDATSVHLEDWPLADESKIDRILEDKVALARRLVVLGRSARTDAKIRTRQPLRRALVLTPRPELLDAEVVAEIKGELNVREVEVVASIDTLVTYCVVPNFRALGPRVGAQMPAVKDALGAVDGAEVRRAFDATGSYALALGSEIIHLGPGDVEIRALGHAELAVAREGADAVALDLVLDDELLCEGLARELSRTLNELRKSTGLEIADRVKVTLIPQLGDESESLAAAASLHGEWIAGEVLALEWNVAELGALAPGSHDVKIGEASIAVVLEKA